jgi:hypothetical protein
MARRRPNIHPYLPPELHKRFRTYCAAKGATESSVAEAALKSYLDGVSDQTLLMRRLDRLGRAIRRLERDNEILLETLATFVRTWMAHTPAIPADQQDAARAIASARYRRFIDVVGDQLGSGRRYAHRVGDDDPPREPLVADEELAAMAEAEADRAQAGETLAPPAPEDLSPPDGQ